MYELYSTKEKLYFLICGLITACGMGDNILLGNMIELMKNE